MYLTQENFQQVLTSSMEKPLFCLFYTEEPESQAAKTALTTAISDSNEFVTLALCNLEDRMCQMLAGQIGLATIPTLVVIDKGNPAAVLEGSADITSRLAETLQQFMPNQSALTMREALQAEAAGNMPEAISKAASAYEAEKTLEYKLIYGRILIKAKSLAKAHELLDNPTREESSNPDYQGLLSALTLAEQAQNSPELLELKRKFEEDDSDENAIAYAVALAEAGKKEEALTILFNKLKQGLDKDQVKKTFLDILSTMDGDKLQSQFRRKLYTLMY